MRIQDIYERLSDGIAFTLFSFPWSLCIRLLQRSVVRTKSGVVSRPSASFCPIAGPIDDDRPGLGLVHGMADDKRGENKRDTSYVSTKRVARSLWHYFSPGNEIPTTDYQNMR